MTNEKLQILKGENKKKTYIEVKVHTLAFMNYYLHEEDTINTIKLHIPIS